jgi:dienelactone hydrolase
VSTPARRIAFVLGALVIGIIALPHLPPVRTAALSAALVPELLDLPIRPLSDSIAAPSRVSTVYGQPADRLDVYIPAGADARSGKPAVVLALGVHPQQIDHPDIARVATAISRLGLFVGVPDSTALRNLDVTPAEPAHLADAVLVLRGWPGVDPARVSLAGFSAGASIALIAATDERIAADLRFVSAFGGYADAELLLVDVATRSATVDGAQRAWQPDPGIRADVLELTLATIPDTEVRRELRELLGPFVEAEGTPGGPRDKDLAQLDGDARAIYLLFTSPDRPSAMSAVATFSAGLRAQLDGISPINFADAVRAPIFLLHGDPDTAIPVGHAQLLHDRLGDRVARFTRFGEFGHGDPGQQGVGPEDMGDVFELYLYLRDIVAAATE